MDSILQQGYKKLEIILIDDGSTDSSGIICDEYAFHCDSVHVIHQKNMGLAEARNVGIRYAKGEYLLFIDSDDYIATNSIDKIVQENMNDNEKIDVIFLRAKKVFPDGRELPLNREYVKKKINNQSKDIVLEELLRGGKFPGSACNKLVRRGLIVENAIFFEKGLLAEDIDWTFHLLKCAEAFACSEVEYYFYRQNRKGSITSTAGKRSVESLLFILDKWAERNIEQNIYQNMFNKFLAYEYMVLICNYGALNTEDKVSIKEKVQNYKWLMKYAQGKKERIVAVVIEILGIEITAYLLAKYNKVRRK